jgi:N-acetylglucosamine-6-phosphate deacetylase
VERVFLREAVLLDPEAGRPSSGSLLLRDGRIEARLAPGEPGPGDARPEHLGGRALAPGFLDLHFHGSMIFHDAAGFEASLAASSAQLLRHGTTAFLATTVAWERVDLARRVGVLAELVARGGFPGAVPIGIHLEGPWLAASAAGAQPAGAIRGYDAAEGAEVLARGRGAIRMLTLAPEVTGAGALLDALGREGVLAALGHSRAGPAEVEAAIARGARHVTHLFNAMAPLHHREPGLAGAALADERLTCDLICDGAHVHPQMVRVAARALGERLLLITDRIEPEPVGVAASSFGSGSLRDDGIALRLPDGRLAGSRVTLDLALRNLQHFAGLSLLEAVAACTLRPALRLGIERERGTLRPGARADFAVLEPDGSVHSTWIGGKPVFRA